MDNLSPHLDDIFAMLECELRALRSLLSMMVEQEQIMLCGSSSIHSTDLGKEQSNLKSLQKKRFELTKSITGCVDINFQDDVFGSWLREADIDCEAIHLWEQIAMHIDKIGEQLARNAHLSQKNQSLPLKEQKAESSRKVDTLEE